MARNLKSSIGSAKSGGAKNSGMRSGGGVDKSAVDNYSGMSEAELMKEMARVAAANKASGALNDAELESFYSKTAPMLTPEQRKRLRTLINSLK